METQRERFKCGTCGRGFANLVHLRSHQSRVCSFAVLDNPSPTEHGLEETGGVEETAVLEEDCAAVVVDSEDDGCGGETANKSDDDGIDIQWVDPTTFKLTDTILKLLDGQTRVADDIYAMYRCLTQTSEPLVRNPVTVPPIVAEIPLSLRAFLNHCTDENLTSTAISRLYNLFLLYEMDIPEEFRVLTKHLPRLGSVHRLLKTLRKAKLYAEGWRVAVIDLNYFHAHLALGIPVNLTGTYRCPLRLAQDHLTTLGIEAVQQFSPSHDGAGRRTYSTPLDSHALEGYTQHVRNDSRILCVDLYCDGVPLPSSGSQSVIPVRVRFSNVSGINTIWFDVGLCPLLEFRSLKCAAEKKAELRRELIRRYMFLMLQPFIDASKVGCRIEGHLVFPRLLMIVCHQKQEIPTVCLRSVGGSRDCTLCDMLSRLTDAEVRRHRKRTTTIRTSSSKDSPDQLQQGEEVDVDSLQRQISRAGGNSRQVVRALGAQLMLTISKAAKVAVNNPILQSLLQKMQANLSSVWFQATNRDIADIRKYLIVQSCCDFPPVFRAVHGLSTEPFYLYNSIEFDSLHVLDLGLIRIFPDLCYIHFSTKHLTMRPASQCISIANKRLIQMPRGAHLPKSELFLTKRNEKLPGITGLIRRTTLPFLWLCVIGLNDKLNPDTAPLVQATLQLAHIHSQLLGCNEPVEARHRSELWIADIQEQSFSLGVQLVNLFDINVTTKMHRFMRHLHCHLTSFGMLRWGANDENESSHKAVKAAYNLTNRRTNGLAQQLLRTGYTDVHDSICEEETDDLPSIPHNQAHPRQLAAPAHCTQHELDTHHSFSLRLQRARDMKYSRSRVSVWRLSSYITLPNKLPWSVDPKHQYVMRQYTYRPWHIGIDMRMDSCVYQVNGGSEHGIVQSIFQSTRFKDHAFLLLRRLEITAPLPGNLLPTTLYNHEYLKYATNEYGGVQIDIVPITDIPYHSFVVVDPWSLNITTGTDNSDISYLEADGNRLKTRF